MSYPPDLRRLRLDGRAGQLPDLPLELWLSILTAVDSDSPCDQVTEKCSVRQEWAALCRDGTVYDLANQKLGWYGEYNSWQDLMERFLRGSRRGRVWHRGHRNNMDPKRWFQHVCGERRAIVNLLVRKENYLYDFRNESSSPARQHEAYGLMENMRDQLRVIIITHTRTNPDNQPRMPYASALCKFAVTIDGSLLSYVPGSVRPGPDTRTRAAPMPEAISGYHEIAKAALKQNGWALVYVHPSRADFGDLARIAVQGFPMALQYVPGSRWYRRTVPALPPRADFAALVRLAMQSDKGIASYRAFEQVLVNSPDYLTLLMAREAIFAGPNRPNVADTSEGWWDIDGQNDGVVRLTLPDWARKTKFAQHVESAARITEIINTTPMAASAECLVLDPPERVCT